MTDAKKPDAPKKSTARKASKPDPALAPAAESAMAPATKVTPAKKAPVSAKKKVSKAVEVLTAEPAKASESDSLASTKKKQLAASDAPAKARKTATKTSKAEAIKDTEAAMLVAEAAEFPRLPGVGSHEGESSASSKGVLLDDAPPVIEPAAAISDLDALIHDVDLDALLGARHPDPYRVLGVRSLGDKRTLRVFVPGALRVAVSSADASVPQALTAVRDGLFVGPCNAQGVDYRLHIEWPTGAFVSADPYAFPPLLTEDDLEKISHGHHPKLDEVLGAHVDTVEGVDGVRFAVWAPNAQRVSVIGDFNGWDGRRHPMRLRHRAGVWEIFIPGAQAGARYKFEIVSAQGHLLTPKADPLARQSELSPATASVVASPAAFDWSDDEWMAQRQAAHAPSAPISVYEVHMGSWLHDAAPGQVWDHLGDRLVDYVRSLGFTHIELMPIMEHPFGGSWGYQPLGMFSPTARYGTPDRFAAFVNRCHQAGIGVILDWVPAHFPNDAHGLVEFDGSALYEYADPREGFHPDWNTMIYNLGRNEVRNFMIASALYWLRTFHIDGLRVDAVASMLYRDYSRKAGEWIPNQYGGRENLESVDFLKALNALVSTEVPGAMMIAEESTAWPGVTAPVEEGGLGFHYKWNMGWMHDTLNYVECEPIHRKYHHNDLTFGMVYAYSEKFILPLSHDEVVHGKGSLIAKMPGDRWQQFATLRAYYGFMFTHPGKKLLFMGSELAQQREWNHDASLDWDALVDPLHKGVQTLVRDLNALYRSLPALHRFDAEPAGFDWVIGDDAANSVAAYYRRDGERVVLVVVNMTPVPREGYRVGVPVGGQWAERLNTDADVYGGSGMGNAGAAYTQDEPAHGQSQSLALVLPPLSTVVFEYIG